MALDGAAWDAAYDYYGHDATGVTYADEVLARAIGWSQHGFCINCGVEPAMVEAVHAAYGAPVLAALSGPVAHSATLDRSARPGAESGSARSREAQAALGLRQQLAGDPVGRAEAPPSRRRESSARRKYRGASCSHVAPMPPCTEIIVRAA